MKLKFSLMLGSILTLFLLLTQLIGCISAESITKGGILSGEKIKVASNVLILPMVDGFGRSDGQWTGSGVAMVNGLKEILIENGFSAIVSDSNKFEEAKIQGESLKFDYILKGVITEWEDNATEWSGRPDSLAVSADLFDISKNKFVSNASHREQSSGTSFVSANTNRFVPVVSNKLVQKMFSIPRMVNQYKVR